MDSCPMGQCRAFELDRWQQQALLKTFQADCPLRYQRPTLEELQSRNVRPYLFGGAQRPACKNCHVAGTRVRICLHLYHPAQCLPSSHWEPSHASCSVVRPYMIASSARPACRKCHIAGAMMKRLISVFSCCNVPEFHYLKLILHV